MTVRCRKGKHDGPDECCGECGAVDPQVKPQESYHDDCCCFHCEAMTSAASNPDCACDAGPFYNRDGCKSCPKASFCDVPKNPQDYLHDDDCGCFKCRERDAEAVRV